MLAAAAARRARVDMDGADVRTIPIREETLTGKLSVGSETEFFETQWTRYPSKLLSRPSLGPVFDAESDGELGFEPKPRPDTVMWIANLQLTGGSTH